MTVKWEGAYGFATPPIKLKRHLSDDRTKPGGSMPFDSILALEGRVSRVRYLLFLAGAYVVYWALQLPLGLGWVALSKTARSEAPELAGFPQMSRTVGVICISTGVVAATVLFFVCISFAVRRFHDINLSGDWNWLIVLVALVPIPGLPTLGFPYPPTPQTSSFLIWHAFLLLAPGSKGRNPYGPAPGEPDTADLAAVFDGDPQARPSE